MATQYIDVAKEATSQQILSTVNNGAKESTSQQILSAGAKESTSQEILSKLESGGGSGSSTSLAGSCLRTVHNADVRAISSFKTILNITGKGKLCFASLTADVLGSSKGSLKITLDDKVICFLTGTCTNSTEPGYLNLNYFNDNYWLDNYYYYDETVYHSRAGRYYPVSDSTYPYYVVTSGAVNKVFNFSSSEQTVSGGFSIGGYAEASPYICGGIFTKDDIPFSKNLKVEYLGNYTDAEYYPEIIVGYTLEE